MGGLDPRTGGCRKVAAYRDEEQKETGDYLVRTLDEDRLSDRQLFPPELKGVTW